MSKIEKLYWKCDVCGKEIHCKDNVAKIECTRNGIRFSFDSCYGCVTNENIKRVYGKVASILKRKDYERMEKLNVKIKQLSITTEYSQSQILDFVEQAINMAQAYKTTPEFELKRIERELNSE